MLTALADDLWTATQPFSVLGLQIGARMTVVRLASGGLFVHAPIELSPELRAALDALGPVEVVVAPNAMHHLYLGACLAAYPQATGYAAAGAAAKHPELSLAPIPERPDPRWSADLDHLHIDGAPKLGEVAFLHKRSRTLILTDWSFYFRDAPNWLTGVYLKLSKGLGKAVQTPVLRGLIKDRAAARASTDKLLAWDFDRVVMSHRDVLERGGKQALRDATAWLKG